jgi:hypothetical protein
LDPLLRKEGNTAFWELELDLATAGKKEIMNELTDGVDGLQRTD